jgi:hypothetical protein
MRLLILAASAALIAAPAFAAEVNGDTGQVYQPGVHTPPASGSAGTAGNAGDTASPGSTAPVGSGGGQAGLRSQGSTPNTNRPMSDTAPGQ